MQSGMFVVAKHLSREYKRYNSRYSNNNTSVIADLTLHSSTKENTLLKHELQEIYSCLRHPESRSAEPPKNASSKREQLTSSIRLFLLVGVSVYGKPLGKARCRHC